MTRRRLKEILLEAPLARAVFHVASNVLVAVFAGAFVYQITGTKGLEWSEFYKHSSFYCLVITTAIIYWYNKVLYQRDRDILKFADTEYCIAYMRSKCLPEAAEQYRLAIRRGDRGELINAMKDLKRVLK